MGRKKRSVWVQRMARSMGIETEGKTDEEILRKIGATMDQQMIELSKQGLDPAGIAPNERASYELTQEVEVIEGGEEVEVDETEPKS